MGRVKFDSGSAGSMAVVMYCKAALDYFKDKTIDEIRNVAYEIAILGTQGINPHNNDKKYSLSSIPNKQFTGLQMLTYEFVAFQQVDPSMDTGLDFQEELKLAKQMQNE